jgi:plasmid stabilization system protein ParE
MKVVWTNLAMAQLYDVFQYYKETVSLKVAKSIKNKIYEKTKNRSRFPEIGQIESNSLIRPLNFRYIVSGNNKVIYKYFKEERIVLIASVFDARQDPNDLRVRVNY